MNKRLGTTGLKILIGVIVALSIIAAAVAVITLNTTGEKGSGLSKDFIYDLNDVAEIDPNLVLYEETGEPIRTGFTESHAIVVVSDGTIYIAGDKAVRIFSDMGQMTSEIKIADKPVCLDIASDGKIYIGMKDHIELYNRQGERLAAWQRIGNNAILTSIAVYKNNVFVADAGNRIVIHYDLTGIIVNHIGRKNIEKNIPGFVVPSPYFDIAAGHDGLLRVINPGLHRIEVYTFDGELEFWWGKFSAGVEGFTGCCNPVTFAILEDGSYVTCEKGLVRVKIYDPDGNFVGVVAGPKHLLEDGVAQICYLPQDCQKGGFDLAVDAMGRVFVLDTIKNIVRIFSKKKAE